MGQCRVCGTAISGIGRRYCKDCVPPITVGGGYIKIYKPGHHKANKAGYVSEQLVVMEGKIGRRLEPGEVIHHVDGDRKNNTPDNLVLFASSVEHIKYHARKRAKKRDDPINQGLREITEAEWAKVWLMGLDKRREQKTWQGEGKVKRIAGLIVWHYWNGAGGWANWWRGEAQWLKKELAGFLAFVQAVIKVDRVWTWANVSKIYRTIQTERQGGR